MSYTRVNHDFRSCKYCGKDYKPKRKDAVFCSRSCKELNRKAPYRVHKGSFCVSCGFIPVHTCQLDVDHIDGNHSNNTLENLQTLCSNCHRLKTHLDTLNKKGGN